MGADLQKQTTDAVTEVRAFAHELDSLRQLVWPQGHTDLEVATEGLIVSESPLQAALTRARHSVTQLRFSCEAKLAQVDARHPSLSSRTAPVGRSSQPTCQRLAHMPEAAS